jgi:selenocysteine-specific elongation factor
VHGVNDGTDTVVPVIIGTAGHVDHGKTSLVELLTGCNTDHLKEERERGISIDLGFAPCRFPGRRLAGVVDVPGHHDFIRNMVAGAAGIDVLMLVVAADDGIMPQTREHLLIVCLLRTPLVLAALTKVDLVEPEMLAAAREELAGFLAAAGHPDAPILPVSNRTGEGIPELRRELERLVDAVDRRPDDRAFRLSVERCFSVPGHGTVLTGIPISGELRPGDEAELWPPGSRHAVRSIQNYRINSAIARSGVCAAINLRDCDHATVVRGHCLAAPGVYLPADELVVAVHNVTTGAWRGNRSLRCHCGTAVTGAALRPLDAEGLPAGATGHARLVLDRPLVVSAGDRFILRTTSPDATVGGGRILSVRGARLRRGQAGLAPRLAAAAAVVDDDPYHAELLAGGSATLAREDLLRLTRRTPAGAAATVAAAIAAGRLIPLGPDAAVVAARAEECSARLRAALGRYHAAHVLAWGMEPEAATAVLDLPASAAADLLRLVVSDPTLVVRHGRLALASQRPRLSAKQIAAHATLADAVVEAGVNGLAPGPAQERTGLTAAEIQLVGQLLVDEGRVLRLGQHLVDAAAIERCRQAVLDHFATHDRLELAAFRTATGTSRNLGVAILEHFDGTGLTVRDGNSRIRRGNRRPGPADGGDLRA